MASNPHAYEVYYPLHYWVLPCSPLLVVYTLPVARGLSSGPLLDRLIVAGIAAGVLLLGWAFAAKFGRVLALRVSSAGITVRTRRWDKRPTTVPWKSIGYLVIWHDGRTMSLSVQPPGGTTQPMRVDGMVRPVNFVTVRARALDEQRLLSAVTRYGPAVQVVDGDTGFAVAAELADQHRTRRSRTALVADRSLRSGDPPP